jgi:hypothetical protein
VRKLLACLWIVVAYAAMAAAVPAIFLVRARNTGELMFYGLWFAGVVSIAAVGAFGCAAVYRKDGAK